MPIVSDSGDTANRNPYKTDDVNEGEQQRKLENSLLKIPHQISACISRHDDVTAGKASCGLEKRVGVHVKIRALIVRADVSAFCAIHCQVRFTDIEKERPMSSNQVFERHHENHERYKSEEVELEPSYWANGDCSEVLFNRIALKQKLNDPNLLEENNKKLFRIWPK